MFPSGQLIEEIKPQGAAHLALAAIVSNQVG
jgi:hypothetical protein